MLISETVKQYWNSKNKERYIKLGYHFTNIKDEFDVRVSDLSRYSRADVIVQCDYCGKEIHKKWINYNSEIQRSVIKKDACQDCQHIKAEETMLFKYNTAQPMHIDEFKQKQKNTNLKKYGFENPSSNKKVRSKVAKTNMERYGGIAPTSSPIVMQKVAETNIKRYGVKSALFLLDHHGANNVNWKNGVSYSYEGRLSLQCIDWKKKVYKKDNYTCQCCGKRNGQGKKVTLNAHHIFNWNDYEDLRYDIENGITLCKECHQKFHKIYGKKFNNKSQIEEFIHNNG